MHWVRAAVGVALVLSACAAEQPPSEPIERTGSRLDAAGPVELPPLGAAAGDRVGWRVAVSGDRSLVGIPYADPQGLSDAGRVAVFERVGKVTWTELSALQAWDAAPEDHFGSALVFEGDTAIVGAPGRLAAYVFVATGAGFGAEQKLTPSNAVSPGLFGSAVSLEQNTALVSAPAEDVGQGAVYVFVRAGSSWTQQARLVASDGFSAQSFGSSVLVQGNLAFIGTAPAPAYPGVVYVFLRSGTTWTEQAKLQPITSTANDRFGASLAVLGSSLLVGAPGLNTVFEFVPDAGGWKQQAQLIGPQASLQFGAGLAADEDVVVVGDPLQSPIKGRAYAYHKLGTSFGVPLILEGSSVARDFGSAIALDPPGLVIGAPQHDQDVFGSLTGAAYAFVIGNGTPCTSGASCPSGHCVEGICCDTACSDPCATCRISSGAPEDGICGVRQKSGVPACGSFACDGTSTQCPTSCDSQDDCVAMSYCDLSTKQCLPSKMLGAACASALECDSQICADGVCCNETCEGCRACRWAMTGAADGQCTAVFGGTDPHDECQADPGFPSSCKADGACDGAGECRLFATKTTPCGATSCALQEVVGMLCDGFGNCEQGSESCGTYLCVGDQCRTDCATGSCSPSGYCSPAKTCEPRRPTGAACSSPDQCESSYCVDGFCCNSACAGQCEWCGDADAPGLCKQVIGKPPQGRPPCPAGDPDNPCSVPSCDGSNGQICAAFPGASVVCRTPSCSGGMMLREAHCDGNGSCLADEALPCGAYACGPTACKPSCQTNDDCAPGNRCDALSGTCSTETVCDGDHTLLGPSGEPTDCWPFRCTSGGTCFTACSSAAQCVEGHVCTSAGRCEARTDASEGEGCSCRAPGSSRDSDFGQSLLIALLALSFAGARSRKRDPRGTRDLLAGSVPERNEQRDL